MPNFTRAQVLELKRLLRLGNPEAVLGKDWYKWFAFNDNGRTDACEVGPRTVNVGAVTILIVSGYPTIKDLDNLFDGSDGIIVHDSGFYACHAYGTWAVGSATQPQRAQDMRYMLNGVQTILASGDQLHGVGWSLSAVKYIPAGGEVQIRANNIDTAAHDITVSFFNVVRVA